MFSVLGLPPLAGRGFRAEDERPGAARVAVIAEALWRRRFGGDAAIVGQSITLNGERHEVDRRRAARVPRGRTVAD